VKLECFWQATQWTKKIGDLLLNREVISNVTIQDFSPPQAAHPGMEWLRAVPPQAAQPAAIPYLANCRRQ